MIDFEMRLKIRSAYLHPDGALKIYPRQCPYSLGIEWMEVMSPIEKLVWSDIRTLGLPLYPQFPVGPYFVDFADPFLKFGVEVDSVLWHQDQRKDAFRQAQIESLGWQMCRIPSSKVFKDREDFPCDYHSYEIQSEYAYYEDFVAARNKEFMEQTAEGILSWLYFEKCGMRLV